MAKNTLRARKRTTKDRRTKKQNRVMRGGTYTDAQIQQLIHLGFTPFFIKLANRGKIGYNRLIHNFHSSNKTAHEYMEQMYSELEINPEDDLTDYESSDTKKHVKKKIKIKIKNKTDRVIIFYLFFRRKSKWSTY